MPRNVVANQTFNDGDLVWQMRAQTDFTNCTFNGVAKRCNFAESTFINCTFAPDFDFEDCNIGGCEGLPERFPCAPRQRGDELRMRRLGPR